MLGRNIKKRKRKRVENKVVDGNKEKMTFIQYQISFFSQNLVYIAMGLFPVFEVSIISKKLEQFDFHVS